MEISMQTDPEFVDITAESEDEVPIQYPLTMDEVQPEQPLYTIRMAVEQPTETTIGTEEARTKQKEESCLEENNSATNAILKVAKRRVRCPECQRYTAETEEKMLRHIRKVHRGENPFQCSMCDYSTYNKSIFEEHVRIHQGIKPFKCSFCSYRSASKKNTKKHELIHRPDNPLKCGQCGFIARHYKALRHHKLSKCQEETLKQESETNLEKLNQDTENCGKKKCGSCKKSYLNNITYKSHMKKCPSCDKYFCPRSIKRHISTVHTGKTKTTKSSKKEFVCALCEWRGTVKPRILLHLIHHPNQEVDESLVDVQILKDFGIMQ